MSICKRKVALNIYIYIYMVSLFVLSRSTRSDPPSVETIPASGELEVNLGETVYMECVAKGVPTPIISWRTKVNRYSPPGLFDIQCQLY